MAKLLTDKHFDPILLGYIKIGRNIGAINMLQGLDEQLQDLVDDFGSTLLHYAAIFGNTCVVNHLISIKRWSKFDIFNSQGRTPLMLAVLNNRPECTKILLDRIDINLHHGHFRTLLKVIFDPSQKLDPEIVKMIFEKIEKANFSNMVLVNTMLETKCPLYYAVYLKNIDVMKTLIDNNVPVNTKNPNNGNSPLHIAVRLKKMDLVQLLLDHGADINAFNNWNNIPMSRPRPYHSGEDLKILRTLIKEGSSLTLQNSIGRMQAYRILTEGTEAEVKVLLRTASSNIDFSVQDRHGDTILHYLARNRLTGLFSLLHDKDFNPNVQNYLGLAPLHYLASKLNLRGMRVLLDKGADVNVSARMSTNVPPLHLALGGARLYKLNCIRDLIWDRRANIQYVTGDGQTALSQFMNEPMSTAAPIVLRYLALLEAQDTAIIEPIRQIIDSTDWIKRDYKLYKSKLDSFKTVEIIESISVFKLLTVSDDRLVGYFRNKELAAKVKRLQYRICNDDTLLNKFMKTRVRNAIEIVQWREKVAPVFGKIARKTVAYGNIIANEVVHYLNLQDLQNLFYSMRSN